MIRSTYTEDTQWEFREFSAIVLVDVVEKYVEIYSDLKTRVIELLINVLASD